MPGSDSRPRRRSRSPQRERENRLLALKEGIPTCVAAACAAGAVVGLPLAAILVMACLVISVPVVAVAYWLAHLRKKPPTLPTFGATTGFAVGAIEAGFFAVPQVLAAAQPVTAILIALIAILGMGLWVAGFSYLANGGASELGTRRRQRRNGRAKATPGSQDGDRHSRDKHALSGFGSRSRIPEPTGVPGRWVGDYRTRGTDLFM